jgi:hypothetical protein
MMSTRKRHALKSGAAAMSVETIMYRAHATLGDVDEKLVVA